MRLIFEPILYWGASYKSKCIFHFAKRNDFLWCKSKDFFVIMHWSLILSIFLNNSNCGGLIFFLLLHLWFVFSAYFTVWVTFFESDKDASYIRVRLIVTRVFCNLPNSPLRLIFEPILYSNHYGITAGRKSDLKRRFTLHREKLQSTHALRPTAPRGAQATWPWCVCSLELFAV